METWRDVVGYEGRYQVSNLGRVRISGPDQIGRKRYQGHIMAAHPKGGYLGVILWRDGRSRNRAIHIMMMEAFVGPRPTRKHQANHLDGNKLRNRLRNLEWTTKNYRHALDVLGHQPAYGEAHWNARVTDAVIIEIKHLKTTTKMTNRELADRFSTSIASISRFINGVSRHVVPRQRELGSMAQPK